MRCASPSQRTRNKFPSVLVALVAPGDVYLCRCSEHVGEEEVGRLQGGEVVGVGVGVAHELESEEVARPSSQNGRKEGAVHSGQWSGLSRQLTSRYCPILCRQSRCP